MYTDYYGFSAKPFQLSPDPRFFFGSRAHTRALAYLRYGLSQGEGFIVITGGIGTGKTTLVKSLFQEFNQNQIVAAQLVTTQLEADELLRSVAASFGLPYEEIGKAALLKHFEDFLRGHARHGRRVLLVVDEVQNLPPKSLEELRMLSNFQVGESPLLQSFLLGQEEFRLTLQEPGMEQLRQRVIASSHLTPLSESETRDYIEHRLRVVGWEGWKPSFVEDAYAAIYRFTQGIPRLINIFCDRLLLYGFLEELNEFSEAAVESVGQELNQNVEGSAPRARSGGGGSRPLMRVSHALEQRLTELEDAMESLLHHPEWQDAQLERMERRIVQLEPAVRVIRRQLADVMRRMDDLLTEETKLADEVKPVDEAGMHKAQSVEESSIEERSL